MAARGCKVLRLNGRPSTSPCAWPGGMGGLLPPLRVLSPGPVAMCRFSFFVGAFDAHLGNLGRTVERAFAASKVNHDVGSLFAKRRDPGPNIVDPKGRAPSCCTAQPPYHHHHMGGGWVSHLIQAPCDEPVSARGRRRWLRPGCPFWLDPAIARAGKLCSCSLSVFSPSSRPWRSLCLPVCDGGPEGGLSAAVPVPVHSPSHDSLILFRLSC